DDGDLLGAQVLADEGDALGGAEDALDGADGAVLVEVLLGLLAEGQGAVLAQGDDRGRPLLALVVGQDLRLAVLEVGHDRVAGAEIDADVGHSANPGYWPGAGPGLLLSPGRGRGSWDIIPDNLFGDNNLGPAQDELRLLAGVAALHLLGDAQGVHAFHAPAADPLVQGRVVGGADDRAEGVDAVPRRGGLALARLDPDRLGPAGHGLVFGPRPGRHDPLQVLADLEQLVEQGQADALLAVDLLAQLLVGPLGVSREA